MINEKQLARALKGKQCLPHWWSDGHKWKNALSGNRVMGGIAGDSVDYEYCQRCHEARVVTIAFDGFGQHTRTLSYAELMVEIKRIRDKSQQDKEKVNYSYVHAHNILNLAVIGILIVLTMVGVSAVVLWMLGVI